MSTMKPIPISKARDLAKGLDADGVAIFVFKGDRVAATSYGADEGKCKDMGSWIDSIVDGMGDGTHGQPFGNGCPWPRITQDD